MLTIEKVKREITRLCGWKDFRILGKDEDVIRVFSVLRRTYCDLQNVSNKYRYGFEADSAIDKKEKKLTETIEEFIKLVERTDV